MKFSGDVSVASTQEPLRELARFSFDFAPHFCDPAHGCAAYHRGWSTIRLHESGGKLPSGFAFFRRELLELAAERGTGRLRIILSGAADIPGRKDDTMAIRVPRRRIKILGRLRT